jgi:DNA-binding transcriptional LysR family regulator
VLTTDPALLVGLARAGAGLAMLYEGQVRDDVARGDLVPVLEEFSTPFPGSTCTTRSGGRPRRRCGR